MKVFEDFLYIFSAYYYFFHEIACIPLYFHSFFVQGEKYFLQNIRGLGQAMWIFCGGASCI